ncbi:MAG TPA: acyl-CoA carboxylase epsilon subunit [Agromyces mariniharenae]|nr:acyl-CoA carboxylase epsilon subunit [Agromyces mariniharenae]
MVDEYTTGGAGAAEGDERAAAIRFITRDVTDEEAAAVTAVLLAALDEGVAEPTAEEPGRDRWVRSGGAMRAPLAVGPGNWARSAC